jgi:hypothetical protein
MDFLICQASLKIAKNHFPGIVQAPQDCCGSTPSQRFNTIADSLHFTLDGGFCADDDAWCGGGVEGQAKPTTDVQLAFGFMGFAHAVLKTRAAVTAKSRERHQIATGRL